MNRRGAVPRFVGVATLSIATMLFAPRGAGTEAVCPGGTSPSPDILFCDDFDDQVDGTLGSSGLPGWADIWIQSGEIAVDPTIGFGGTGKSLRFRYQIPVDLEEHQDDNTSLIQRLTPTDVAYLRGYIYVPAATPMYADGPLPMPGNAWSRHATYANVYQTPIASSRPMTENGMLLNRAGDLATLATTPGSFHVANGIGYIRTNDDSNPSTNGRIYASQTCIQRKLLYYKSEDWGAINSWHFVLSSDSCPEDPEIVLRVLLRPNVGTTDPTTDIYDIGRLMVGVWHRLEVETRLNALGSADGTLRIWLDDTLILERTNATFRASARDLRTIELGRQVDRVGHAPIDHHWHWDNIVVSRSYIGPVNDPTIDRLAPARPIGVQVD